VTAGLTRKYHPKLTNLFSTENESNFVKNFIIFETFFIDIMLGVGSFSRGCQILMNFNGQKYSKNWRHDILHNDTQPNNTQPSNVQDTGTKCIYQHKNMYDDCAQHNETRLINIEH
jgi:hypothetical protein